VSVLCRSRGLAWQQCDVQWALPRMQSCLLYQRRPANHLAAQARPHAHPPDAPTTKPTPSPTTQLRGALHPDQRDPLGVQLRAGAGQLHGHAAKAGAHAGCARSPPAVARGLRCGRPPSPLVCCTPRNACLCLLSPTIHPPKPRQRRPPPTPTPTTGARAWHPPVQPHGALRRHLLTRHRQRGQIRGQVRPRVRALAVRGAHAPHESHSGVAGASPAAAATVSSGCYHQPPTCTRPHAPAHMHPPTPTHTHPPPQGGQARHRRQLLLPRGRLPSGAQVPQPRPQAAQPVRADRQGARGQQAQGAEPQEAEMTRGRLVGRR